MKALLELQKQMEIDFLKEHSYEQINDMFRELKTKLDNAESKVKNLDIQRVRERISNMKDDSGRAGCTYGDTDYRSEDVVYGYNLAIEHVVEYLKKL